MSGQLTQQRFLYIQKRKRDESKDSDDYDEEDYGSDAEDN